MKRLFILLMIGAVLLSGCAYNSRNIIAVFGKRMNFSYGLISVKQVDKIIFLRETNAGSGKVENNLKDIEDYIKCEK